MIRQTCYIDDVVRLFNQQDAKAVANPRDLGVKLSKMQSLTTDSDNGEMKSDPYRSLIGCLLYIMSSMRPDVAYVVTQLFGKSRTKGTTRDFGIIYDGSTSETQITEYMAADQGCNFDDRRSILATMVSIGGAPRF